MTDNFSKVPNPLDGIVITKPPKTPPIIRGRGNPIDEAAAARLVTFDEMLAGVTKTPRPAKTDETPRGNQADEAAAREIAAFVAVTKTQAGVTKTPTAMDTVTKTHKQGGRPKLPVTKTPAERMRAYRARAAQ
jgi:hypothetical protein